MHILLINAYIDICDNQYGFRAKQATYMALFNIMDQILVEMDNRKYSIDIFLDLSKAFDTIDHKILLKKLKMYGIRGTALKWFSSFLSRVTQFVSLGYVISNLSHIKCGVTQSSVLEPL